MKKVVLMTSALAVSSLFAGKNVIPAPVEPVSVPTPQVPVAQSETLYNANLKFGTLGFGLDISRAINPNLAIRLNAINYFKFNKKTNIGDIDYDAHLKLLSVGLLLDYFPSSTSTFRLTTGAYYNKNKLYGTAKPTATASVTIGGTTYTSSQVVSVDTSVTFKKFAPYIGIGWGNKPSKDGWQFSFDLGAMYQGTPKIYAKATPNSSMNAAQIATLNANVEKERVKIYNDVKKYKWYPVVSIGISKSF